MRRLLFMLLGPLGAALSAIVLAAGPAAADSPHFISEGTASINSSGAYVVTNFKEAGLGNTANFAVRNGQTTGSLSVGPPAAGPFQPPCSPPQTVVLAFVSYTNVELIGLAGDTSAEPDLSACLVTGSLATAGCP